MHEGHDNPAEKALQPYFYGTYAFYNAEVHIDQDPGMPVEIRCPVEFTGIACHTCIYTQDIGPVSIKAPVVQGLDHKTGGKSTDIPRKIATRAAWRLAITKARNDRTVFFLTAT